MSLNEKTSRNQLKPDRYYTPQVKNPNGPIHTTGKCPCTSTWFKLTSFVCNIVYEPTPSPESVVFHKKSRTPKNESCCLAW